MKQLEASINESQSLEKQLLEISQWMTEVNREIQNRLDADVLAGDVPEESEVSLVVKLLINSSVKGSMSVFSVI